MTDVDGVVNIKLLDKKTRVVVYSGTYAGKEAVNKYIIIKNKNEESFYELSLEIYRELSKNCVGICKLLNYNFFGENPRNLRITMENCGVDLFYYIGILDLRNEHYIEILLKIAHDVLSAIICLNNMNLVHGDIKVENITITGDSANNVEAKLIDLDSIGYVEKKESTKRGDEKYDIYNIPTKWFPLSRTLPKINLGSKLPLVIDTKLVNCIRYIDIFSWCDLFLLILPRYPTPPSPLSSSYIKAYMFESLVSDMYLPDINIDTIPEDTSGIVIDVNYCEKVKSFLLWLKDVDTDILSFPEKNRKKWWASFKKKWWETTTVNLAGEPLGGGYNKSNHKRSIRKNKYHLSKRLKKRKYKRTNKRKYKKNRSITPS
jgi:serine/threonine protein kinase